MYVHIYHKVLTYVHTCELSVSTVTVWDATHIAEYTHFLLY